MKKVFLGIVIGAILSCAIAYSIVLFNNDNLINVRTSAINSFKTCLLNETWINDNLKMKKNCFGDEMKSDLQDLTFEMIDMGKDVAPVIVVNAYIYNVDTDNNEFGNQIFIVRYENNQVVVDPLTEVPAHPSHLNYLISSEYGIIEGYYMHMGVHDVSLYDISNKDLIFNYGYNETVEKNNLKIAYYINEDKVISEDAFNELKAINEKHTKTIDNKLTAENVENIVK